PATPYICPLSLHDALPISVDDLTDQVRVHEGLDLDRAFLRRVRLVARTVDGHEDHEHVRVVRQVRDDRHAALAREGVEQRGWRRGVARRRADVELVVLEVYRLTFAGLGLAFP